VIEHFIGTLTDAEHDALCAALRLADRDRLDPLAVLLGAAVGAEGELQAALMGVLDKLAEALGANAGGVQEVIFQQITPGQTDYTGVIAQLQDASIDVLFYGGYTEEAALLIRQAHTAGDDLQMIGGDGLVTEYFWLVARDAAVGVRFVSLADPRNNEEAAAVVERFRTQGYEPEGFTLYSYAAVQVWAQAVEKAGTFAADAVAETLRSETFATVLGTIGFDAKGDVAGYDPFTWYVWQEGDYEPVAVD
jgi:branched-chain amino acid transport system substrate-binding protein